MVNIENIINKYLSEKQAEESKKHSEYSGLITASILGQCHRRQFYSIMKIEQSNPPDERALRVFACGNVFHEFIQNIVCLTLGKDYQIEVEYKNNDVSIRVDIKGDDAVYELKSQHSRKFWYIQDEIKKGKTLFDFQPEHILQVGLGALMLKKEWACIIYISKDDLCTKQFNFKTKEITPMVIKELSLVKEMLKRATLPPPEPRLYGKDKKGNYKECQYCNWKDRCMSERNG